MGLTNLLRVQFVKSGIANASFLRKRGLFRLFYKLGRGKRTLSYYMTLFCLISQDLCQLVNADAPYWLVGMTEMTRTCGLELLESVLNDFPQVFLQVSQ